MTEQISSAALRANCEYLVTQQARLITELQQINSQLQRCQQQLHSRQYIPYELDTFTGYGPKFKGV